MQVAQSRPSAKSQGADAYDDPSWWYDIRGFFILMGTYQVTLPSHLRFFARNLGGRHLEAAVGSGTFLSLTMAANRLKGRARPKEIVGIDYAERMLRGARRLFRRKSEVQLVRADLSQIDYPDGYFDSVNIAHSFHALPKPEPVLKELHRVIKPGSKIFADVLLHPRGGRMRRALAIRVNNFCYQKGILARTCDMDETMEQFSRHGFELHGSHVRGNTLHIVAERKTVRRS